MGIYFKYLTNLYDKTNEIVDGAKTYFASDRFKNLKTSVNETLDKLENSTIQDVYQKTSQVARQVLTNAQQVVNQTGHYLAEKGMKSVFPNSTQEQIESFKTSSVAQAIKNTTTHTIPVIVGSAIAGNVGTVYPGTALGYTAGKELSEYLLPESADRPLFAGLRKFARTALISGATLLGFSADTMAPTTVLGPIGSYVLQTGGMIAAQRTTLQLGGMDPLANESSHVQATSYIPRTVFSSLAGTGVKYLCSISPLTSGVVGTVVENAASFGAYYHDLVKIGAKEIMKKRPTPNYNVFNLGYLLKAYINPRYGNSQALLYDNIQSSRIPALVKLMLADLTRKGIQEEHLCNCMIRSLNDYLICLQDPTISQEITSYIQTPEKNKKFYKLYNTIFNSNKTKNILHRHVKSSFFGYIYQKLGFIDTLADSLIQKIDSLEQEAFGATLPHMHNRDALKTHLKLLLIMILSKTKNSLTQDSQPLQEKEIENFYTGLTQLLTTYYPVSGWISNGINYFIVKMINNHKFFTRLIDRLLEIDGTEIEAMTERVQDPLPTEESLPIMTHTENVEGLIQEAMVDETETFEDALDDFSIGNEGQLFLDTEEPETFVDAPEWNPTDTKINDMAHTNLKAAQSSRKGGVRFYKRYFNTLFSSFGNVKKYFVNLINQTALRILKQLLP